MPEEVENRYENLCKSGKLSNKWKKYMKDKDLDCKSLGKAVASIVGNLVKRRRSIKGGTSDGADRKSGYMTEPNFDVKPRDDGYVWVKICDEDTKLKFGENDLLQIDETAHMANLGVWTSQLYNIEHNIDHNKDNKIKVDIKEARYDVGSGLFNLVKAEDPEINSRIANGVIKPSIEGDILTDKDVIKGSAHFYIPTGIGWMYEDQAMSKNAGPDIPSNDALKIKGGTKMDEGKDSKTKEEPKEEKKDEEQPNSSVKKGAEAHEDKKLDEDKKPTEEGGEDGKKEDKPVELSWEERFKELENKLKEKEKAHLETLNKINKKEETAIQELKKMYASQLPEGFEIDMENDSLEEIKKMVSLTKVMQSNISGQIEKKIKEVEYINPNPKEKDTGVLGNPDVDKMGNMSEEAYARIKSRQYIDRGMKLPEDLAKHLKK